MRKILTSLLVFISFCSKALMLDPMVLEMTSKQQGAIVLTNPSNREVAVDAEALEILFKQNNRLKSVTNELLVFPPAFILKPGAKQHVKLIWNSPKKMAQARSFYIRFETPTLQRISNQKGSNLDVQIDYNALVHISENAHTAKLLVKRQYIKQNHLILELFNAGKKYDHLENYQLKSNTVLLSNQKLTEVLGNVFFPPLSGSTLSIPFSSLPKNFSKQQKILLQKTTY